MRLNPVFVREMRVRMCSTRLLCVMLSYAGLLAAVVCIGLAQSGEGLAAESRDLYQGLCLGQMLLLIFMAPALSAGTISVERERKTLKLLAVTLLKPWAVVWGKFAVILVCMLLLLASSLPIFGLCLMLGGLSPREVGLTYLLCLVTAVAMGTIAMFCSSLYRKTSRATGAAFSMIFLLILVPYAVYYLIEIVTGAKVGQLLIGNPVAAVLSVMGRMQGAWRLLGFRVPLWGMTLLIYPVVSVVLAALTVARVRRAATDGFS